MLYIDIIHRKYRYGIDLSDNDVKWGFEML